MLIEIGPESQCFEGYDQKTNLYKYRGKIPLFGRIRPELQCLQWKDKIRIPVFVRIGPELKSSEGWAEYSNL